MLAMPVATISLCVFASSQAECTSAFRPRLSGIHNAPYPHSSTRFAKAAAAAAGMPSIEIQTPSFPSSIAGSPAEDRASVNRRTRCVQLFGTPPFGMRWELVGNMTQSAPVFIQGCWPGFCRAGPPEDPMWAPVH